MMKKQEEKLEQLLTAKSEENDLLRDKNLRMEASLRELENRDTELRRLKDMLQQKVAENERLKKLEGLQYSSRQIELGKECDQLKRTLEATQAEKDNLQATFSHIKNQYETELTRLAKELKEVSEELRRREASFSQNARECKLAQEEKAKAERLLTLREQDLIDWKAKYSRIEKTLNDLKGSESEAVAVFAEVERLRHLLQLKESEIEKWMQKNRELNF